MSDTIKIKVEVNGKSVPLSDISMETIGKIRDGEQEENVPVFSVADNVLIIKLTDKCKEALKDAMEEESCSYISLDKDGSWYWGFDSSETFADVKKQFSKGIKPLFEEN